MLTMEPAERQALGLAARARIAREYSLDAAVRRYERLYEGLSAA
jgi:glycosyltransferase involved in cell wall biosynthesis